MVGVVEGFGCKVGLRVQGLGVGGLGWVAVHELEFEELSKGNLLFTFYSYYGYLTLDSDPVGQGSGGCDVGFLWCSEVRCRS